VADPDVGQGTFYILVELPDGGATPQGTQVTVAVKPEDGHEAESAHPAERQQTRYGERFVAKVPFSSEGQWQVRLIVQGPAGRGETTFPIQVTPSGLGWLATVACLLPFIFLAALWLRSILRERQDSISDRSSGDS
jgi:hypothetical protein